MSAVFKEKESVLWQIQVVATMNWKWIWSVTCMNVYWWRKRVCKSNHDELHNWQESYSWVHHTVHFRAQLYSEVLLMHTSYNKEHHVTECRSI